MADAWTKALKKSMQAARSEQPLSTPTSVTRYVWLSIQRWPDLGQGFLLLQKAELHVEAMCLSRPAAELAINAGWIVFGNSAKFPTPESRVVAMEEESRQQQKKWWEAMQRHKPEGFSKGTTDAWTAFCALPKTSESPPDLCTRAHQQRAPGTLAAQLYDFAWRVDSQAMHSNTRVLVTRARGRLPLSSRVVLLNMLSAGRLLFFAAAEAFGSPAISSALETLIRASQKKARES